MFSFLLFSIPEFLFSCFRKFEFLFATPQSHPCPWSCAVPYSLFLYSLFLCILFTSSSSCSNRSPPPVPSLSPSSPTYFPISLCCRSLRWALGAQTRRGQMPNASSYNCFVWYRLSVPTPLSLIILTLFSVCVVFVPLINDDNE